MDDDGIELRVVVPRSALVAPTRASADFYSQQNCEGLLGIPRRTFLELLRRVDAPPVTRVGRLRLVEREPMLAFLRALRAQQEGAPQAELDAADQILAELGCVPRRERSGIR